MSKTLNTSLRWHLLSELPAGKCISGRVITCANCRLQILITSKGLTQGHRWWEGLGWGKIGNMNMGHGAHMKGDLFCSACFPAIHDEVAGEFYYDDEGQY